MSSSSKEFTGEFYDADYFERGRESGKGWLSNYKWMPIRSIKEALAYIDTLQLNEHSYILDIGCAKGFIVKALRLLEIKADGCDISEYALSFAPSGCWNCSKDLSWAANTNKYTHVIIKDVLEHLTLEQLEKMLNNISKICSNIMCVIPMGDNGKYRIKEYHIEISHLIAEDEIWWENTFKSYGWNTDKKIQHVSGLKDNWQTYADGKGNCVFILSKMNT